MTSFLPILYYPCQKMAGTYTDYEAIDTDYRFFFASFFACL